MKKLFLLLVLILICLFSIGVKAQCHNMMGSHVLLNKDKLVWNKVPPSLPPGAMLAVLEGDMSKEGPFTVRLTVPANYKIPPHWHPAIEHVTVVKGSFYMGSGEKFDEAAATKLTVGGFAVMPVKHVHYAFSKEAAEIQLHGMGPWGITYINAADDPRNKKP